MSLPIIIWHMQLVLLIRVPTSWTEWNRRPCMCCERIIFQRKIELGKECPLSFVQHTHTLTTSLFISQYFLFHISKSKPLIHIIHTAIDDNSPLSNHYSHSWLSCARNYRSVYRRVTNLFMFRFVFQHWLICNTQIVLK